MATQSLEPKPWMLQGDAKREAVKGLFAEIAPKYDLLNSLMSLHLHHRWRAAAVRELELSSGDLALDICCGTGDFFAPLRKAVGTSGTVLGVDFCLPMLEIAERKLPREPVHLGDACRLPFRNGRLDGVSVGWGIRNVPDIDGAHQEAYRVLQTGGRFVSLDMAQPKNRLIRAASGFIALRIMPFLGRILSNKTAYKYLPESSKRFLSREELKSSMEAAGFVDVRWRDLFLGNICIHVGRKP